MPRPKGLPKTGGRVKGTLNKSSSFLANDLEAKGFNFSDELLKVYDQLDVDKKAFFLLKIMDFMYSKPVKNLEESVEQKTITNSRYYTESDGQIWLESKTVQPDGQTVTICIPDNGSAVDSPKTY